VHIGIGLGTLLGVVVTYQNECTGAAAASKRCLDLLGDEPLNVWPVALFAIVGGALGAWAEHKL
jgi:hypothetical protein